MNTYFYFSNINPHRDVIALTYSDFIEKEGINQSEINNSFISSYKLSVSQGLQNSLNFVFLLYDLHYLDKSILCGHFKLFTEHDMLFKMDF